MEKKKTKEEYKEKTVVEALNSWVEKLQEFTDNKLDKLEEKLNNYTIN